MESEFEVVDDIVYDFMVFDKSNDFHFCTAMGTEEEVYLIDFADHPGPAFGGHIAVLLEAQCQPSPPGHPLRDNTRAELSFFWIKSNQSPIDN